RLPAEHGELRRVVDGDLAAAEDVLDPAALARQHRAEVGARLAVHDDAEHQLLGVEALVARLDRIADRVLDDVALEGAEAVVDALRQGPDEDLRRAHPRAPGREVLLADAHALQLPAR